MPTLDSEVRLAVQSNPHVGPDDVVFRDRHGEPAVVATQEEYATLAEHHPGKLGILAAAGITVDETTIRDHALHCGHDSCHQRRECVYA